MNNNRGNNNNNRRRGRGNNNRQSGGGGSGQQLNRIDSRARGNAPQLLEKYRKLAHDAHLNGDRVTEEYNLQFADHYFRVLADTRVRQDEQRVRRDDGWQEGAEGEREDGEDGSDMSGDSDYASYNPGNYQRREREERPREERPREDRPRDERPREDRPRQERPRREPRPVRESEEQAEAPQVEAAAEEAVAFEPAENPFVRDNRAVRGLRPRRDDRRPRRDDADADQDSGAQGAGLDPALLPPAISIARDAPAEDVAVAAPKPRGRPRRKPAGDDTGETLESVG